MDILSIQRWSGTCKVQDFLSGNKMARLQPALWEPIVHSAGSAFTPECFPFWLQLDPYKSLWSFWISSFDIYMITHFCYAILILCDHCHKCWGRRVLIECAIAFESEKTGSMCRGDGGFEARLNSFIDTCNVWIQCKYLDICILQNELLSV